MENRIKETFNKIGLDTDRRDTMREAINNRKSRNNIWIRAVACAAACTVLLFSFPTTRAFIVNAATDLIRVFYTADGSKVTYIEESNETQFVFSYDNNKSYATVENGRLYFTFENEKIDVTDECSNSTYYRHELLHSDGSKSVIFVGGTIDNSGWVELMFDKDGNYVFNQMWVVDDSEWVTQAMHNEGVPCGDPSLDDVLENK